MWPQSSQKMMKFTTIAIKYFILTKNLDVNLCFKSHFCNSKDFKIPMQSVQEDLDRELNIEQSVVRDLITNYVNDALQGKDVKPLRLIVTGLPLLKVSGFKMCPPVLR